MWMVSVAVALAAETEPLRVGVVDEAGVPIRGAEVAVVVAGRTGAIVWRSAPAEITVRDLWVSVAARAPGFRQGSTGRLHVAGDRVEVTLQPGVPVSGVVRGSLPGDGWVVTLSGPAPSIAAAIRIPLDGRRFQTDRAFPGTWRMWLWRPGQDRRVEDWIEQSVVVGEVGADLRLHTRSLRR